MKANHNASLSLLTGHKVVVNISSSKNESKSQQTTPNPYSFKSCCKYQ
nr:hypothetical protein [Pedobacter puniceum]